MRGPCAINRMSGQGAGISTNKAFSAARRSGQAGGSLPPHDQPRGLGLWCKCPHLRPEGGVITPLCSAGGAVRCSSSVAGGSLPCGMLFSTVSCVSPLESAKAVSGTKQKPRKISTAPVVQLTAHARPISSELPAIPVLLEIPHPVDRTLSVLQRCPLGHVHHNRMDLMLVSLKTRYLGR